jgi:hypothetical protein
MLYERVGKTLQVELDTGNSATALLTIPEDFGIAAGEFEREPGFSCAALGATLQTSKPRCPFLDVPKIHLDLPFLKPCACVYSAAELALSGQPPS